MFLIVPADMYLWIWASFALSSSVAEPLYRHLGCFADINSDRVLPTWFCSSGGGTDDTNGCLEDAGATDFSNWAGGASMTPTVCSALCHGHEYFGIEVGYQCFCGDSNKKAIEKPMTQCNSKCTGERELASNCGGLFGTPGAYEGRISIYQRVKAHKLRRGDQAELE